MNNRVLKLMEERTSVRAYLSQQPHWAQVRQAVEASARAASSKNIQPWTLELLREEALSALRHDYLKAFDEGIKPNPPYQYAPQPMPDQWRALARECGYDLFEHKGILRDDYEARRAHDRENFEFFQAPGLFILSTRADAERGNFLDCGMFLQNLILALESIGLGSCPQFSAVAYPEILRKHCPEADELFVCGLSFGIPDQQAHINTFRTTRRPVQDWFHEYGDNI